MTSNIKIGQKIKVTVRFIGYDLITGEDDLVNPTSVTASLYKYDELVNGFSLQGDLTPVIQQALGIFSVDWIPTDNGRYRILFVGLTPAATPSRIENPRDFYIGTAEPSIILGQQFEYNFLPELDPLFIDPERVRDFFADVDLVEATEIIYRNSLELQNWFGESVVPTNLMQEYILAATLCELSKIHVYDGGLAGFSAAKDYTLGDLKVGSGSGGGSTSKNSVYRGNVANWCELASLIRDELNYNRVNMKGVIRGGAFENPMPVRKLRRFD